MQGKCWPTHGCGCWCLPCPISNTPGKVRGSTPPQHLPTGGKLQKTREIMEPRSQVFSTRTTDSPENSCGMGLGSGTGFLLHKLSPATQKTLVVFLEASLLLPQNTFLPFS